MRRSGAASYESVESTTLTLPADIPVTYIYYEGQYGKTRTKNLQNYLQEGGDYFSDPTTPMLIVERDDNTDEISGLTEIYRP
jgi:hypothetical protein